MLQEREIVSDRLHGGQCSLSVCLYYCQSTQGHFNIQYMYVVHTVGLKLLCY